MPVLILMTCINVTGSQDIHLACKRIVSQLGARLTLAPKMAKSKTGAIVRHPSKIITEQWAPNSDTVTLAPIILGAKKRKSENFSGVERRNKKHTTIQHSAKQH
uniref:Uncharacterized protein n=1 Tax=Romanomermis culicivorax TaxID=13658 RepID=A0A915LE09_ROMCU